MPIRRKKIPKTRKFDGKNFRLVKSKSKQKRFRENTFRNAKNHQGSLKKQGFKARIVQNEQGYFVYTNKK